MIKSKHKGFAENLLFALNIFIIFFLLFGSSIAIPQWLQPVGRMHPLILHFPIPPLLVLSPTTDELCEEKKPAGYRKM